VRRELVRLEPVRRELVRFFFAGACERTHVAIAFSTRRAGCFAFAGFLRLAAAFFFAFLKRISPARVMMIDPLPLGSRTLLPRVMRFRGALLVAMRFYFLLANIAMPIPSAARIIRPELPLPLPLNRLDPNGLEAWPGAAW
jgi:hypothetical protein